jgi:hypothetical protein
MKRPKGCIRLNMILIHRILFEVLRTVSWNDRNIFNSGIFVQIC